MDREAWSAAVHGLQRAGHDWVTELNWHKGFSTMLDIGLRKTVKKEEMEKLKKQTKWNGSNEYEL